MAFAPVATIEEIVRPAVPVFLSWIVFVVEDELWLTFPKSIDVGLSRTTGTAARPFPVRLTVSELAPTV